MSSHPSPSSPDTYPSGNAPADYHNNAMLPPAYMGTPHGNGGPTTSSPALSFAPMNYQSSNTTPPPPLYPYAISNKERTPPDTVNTVLRHLSGTRGGEGGENGVDSFSMSGASSNASSSVREDLPLCPEDAMCRLVNDRTHQRQYAHTCRLTPCYHGHVKAHSRFFRHAPDQCIASVSTATDSGSSSKSGSTHHRTRKSKKTALKTVNFEAISPDAANAVPITIVSGNKCYDIFGDWANVKIHTFKRYLHQVLGIPPANQKLLLNFNEAMDDDIASVASYNVKGGTTIAVVEHTESESFKLDDTQGGIVHTPGGGVAKGAPLLLTPKNSGSGLTSQNGTPTAMGKTTGGPQQGSIRPSSHEL